MLTENKQVNIKCTSLLSNDLGSATNLSQTACIISYGITESHLLHEEQIDMGPSCLKLDSGLW